MKVILNPKAMINARNTKWKSKSGEIAIKNMATPHIERALNIVRNHDQPNFGGLSTSYLELVMNSELQYRNRLGTDIIKKFPKFNKELNAILNSK